MGGKKNNQLVQLHNHHHHHQISSFNLACCLRPPSPPSCRSWLPFLCHFSTTPRSIEEVDSRRTTPQLTKSSTLASSTSSSSQLLERDGDGRWDAVIDKGPASPKVGCMGQVRRNDSKVRLQSHFSRMFYLTSTSGKSAKVGDHCSSGRQEAEYAAETMDLPLPVPKRDVVAVDSLWKRRRGTDVGGLGSLDVQQLKTQQAQQLHLHLGFGCTRHLEA